MVSVKQKLAVNYKTVTMHKTKMVNQLKVYKKKIFDKFIPEEIGIFLIDS
jgi:hypothetical protein